jgi:tRNA(Ile)-lysidine synthase TilS/MesJ
VNHIVGLSGGKDSTAMALRLTEVEPREYAYICTPTGNEPAEMQAHWSHLEGLLGQPLIRQNQVRVGIRAERGHGSSESL